jgi:hypothetical protein
MMFYNYLAKKILRDTSFHIKYFQKDSCHARLILFLPKRFLFLLLLVWMRSVQLVMLMALLLQGMRAVLLVGMKVLQSPWIRHKQLINSNSSHQNTDC